MYGQAPSSEKLQTGFYCWSEQREKAEVPTVSQEEAGRVCSQTPSRKKKLGDGCFGLLSVLSPGQTAVGLAHVSCISCFFICCSPVGPVNEWKPCCLSELGDLAAHPSGGRYKCWSAKCVDKLLPSKMKLVTWFYCWNEPAE